MDFTIFDDFFTEYVFSWGSRTSAPSWRARRHGLLNAIFLLTGLLMRFQPNCMAWTFEYVATYANACSLLQPCEPLCWSWTCRPAVLGEEKASCAMRQTHAVHFSSGELLLLSHSCAWNGVYASYLTHKLVVCALLSGLVGGNCSFVDRQFSVDFGEETTAQLLFPLGPVPSPGAISFSCAQL